MLQVLRLLHINASRKGNRFVLQQLALYKFIDRIGASSSCSTLVAAPTAVVVAAAAAAALASKLLLLLLLPQNSCQCVLQLVVVALHGPLHGQHLAVEAVPVMSMQTTVATRMQYMYLYNNAKSPH